MESIYRHFIIPGFESFIKGRGTFRFWRELEESQWWPRERLQALQLRRLRRLLRHCFQYSPWYRHWWSSLGLELAALKSLQDFSRWPITSRAAMRDYASHIRSTAPGIHAHDKATGGSSGEPLQFTLERQAAERRMAAVYRGYSWAGARPGTRQSHLWGSSLCEPSRLRRWKEHLYHRYLYRRDMLNSFDLSDESIPQFLRRIRRFRPEILVAYPNPLYQLARAVEQQGLCAYRPKAIVVGAEKLHDFQRDVLQKVFAAPVFETYGSREFTLIGAECEQHAGLHLTMENLLVEIVDDDGDPTPDGREGRVVVTDFFNTATPFVRYATGDRAVAGFGTCPCGRGLPLLRQVAGRELDTLVTVDGRRLPGEFFPHLIKDYDAIRQFQVVQHSSGVVELKLVPDRHWSPADRTALQNQVQASLGNATRLLISEVDSIPLTDAGKLRVVVRHTNEPAAAHALRCSREAS